MNQGIPNADQSSLSAHKFAQMSTEHLPCSGLDKTKINPDSLSDVGRWAYASWENFAHDNKLKPATVWKDRKGSNMILGSLLPVFDNHKVLLEDYFQGLK